MRRSPMVLSSLRTVSFLCTLLSGIHREFKTDTLFGDFTEFIHEITSVP